MIDVNSAYTKAEAYAKSGATQSVGFDFGTTAKVTEFALHQNIPNPFTGETMIGFELPKAAAVVLTISDISGKEIKTIKGEFAKGYNSITLQSEDLPDGVLNYQIITDGYQATRQMVVIR